MARAGGFYAGDFKCGVPTVGANLGQTGQTAGGAGLERTVDANRRAFDRWRILPHMLNDVSQRDASIDLFGVTLPGPFLLAPVGVLEMAHRQADVAVAKAAAAEGVPMIFSSQASRPMEECAAAMGDSPRWFQLYWSKSDDLVLSFVARAEACGCRAIVVTLDTTLLGWRTRDLDMAYLPFLRGKGIAQYTSDPVFTQQISRPLNAPPARTRITLSTLASFWQLLRSYPGGFFSNLTSGKPRRAVQHWIDVFSRPSLTWDDLQFLRKHTRLPVLLKGILRADDASKALDYGVDGLIVSNHGGRQVDGAIASLDALPGIVDAVKGRVPILIDSGVRGGDNAAGYFVTGSLARSDRFLDPVREPEYRSTGTYAAGYVTDYFGRTVLEAKAPAAGVVLYICGVPSMKKGDTIANIGVVAVKAP